MHAMLSWRSRDRGMLNMRVTERGCIDDLEDARQMGQCQGGCIRCEGVYQGLVEDRTEAVDTSERLQQTHKSMEAM